MVRDVGETGVDGVDRPIVLLRLVNTLEILQDPTRLIAESQGRTIVRTDTPEALGQHGQRLVQATFAP